MSTEVTTITAKNYREQENLVKAAFMIMARKNPPFDDFDYEFNIVNSGEPMIAFYSVGESTHIFALSQVEEFGTENVDERRKLLEHHLVNLGVNRLFSVPSTISLHDMQIIINEANMAFARMHNLNQITQEGIE